MAFKSLIEYKEFVFHKVSRSVGCEKHSLNKVTCNIDLNTCDIRMTAYFAFEKPF